MTGLISSLHFILGFASLVDTTRSTIGLRIVLNSEQDEGHDDDETNRQEDQEVKVATRPIIIVLTLLVVPVLMLFPLGHASSTTTCTGTTSNAFVPTGPPTNVVTNTVDGYAITKENFGLCFTGAFNGNTQGKVTIVVSLSTGNGIFFGQNMFTGTVTTSSGTSSGTILVPFAATFSSGNFQGPYTLYGGTGGLKDLSGFGTIQGSLTTFKGTYTASFFTS
jgi:hypothetical protein